MYSLTLPVFYTGTTCTLQPYLYSLQVLLALFNLTCILYRYHLNSLPLPVFYTGTTGTLQPYLYSLQVLLVLFKLTCILCRYYLYSLTLPVFYTGTTCTLYPYLHTLQVLLVLFTLTCILYMGVTVLAIFLKAFSQKRFPKGIFSGRHFPKGIFPKALSLRLIPKAFFVRLDILCRCRLQ